MVFIPPKRKRHLLLGYARSPEAKLFPTPEHLKDALWKAHRELRGTWRFRVTFVIVIGVLLLMLFFVMHHMPSFGWPLWLRLVIVYLIWFVFLAIFKSRFIGPYYLRKLREQLIELGILVCLHCGYDLRGQTINRCPECGKEFDKNLLQTNSQF